MFAHLVLNRENAQRIVEQVVNANRDFIGTLTEDVSMKCRASCVDMEKNG
jgi:hypothetical protein